MTTLTEVSAKMKHNPMVIGVNQWLRITLLTVLGYEAAGCLLGGGLLVAAPDGRYMDMPVDMMNGFFPDFFIPGIILFALGLLNTYAFISVLRKSPSDWFMAMVALGGLAIWFVVEIIILQELHWLHFMWGFPVFVGLVVAIPLVVSRSDPEKMNKVLLTCGILSSLWYVVINIFVPLQDSNYSIVNQAVSELSAIGAPTRVMWILLAIPFLLFFVAFGWGVFHHDSANQSLRVVGRLMVVYGIFTFYWPPMQMRGNEMALTDILHLIWGGITLLMMIVFMVYGAKAFGKQFRLFTLISIVLFIVFGILTGIEGPHIAANEPTPMIGVWERINIGIFMLWVVVFAIALLRQGKSSYSNWEDNTSLKSVR